jgi:hypothetical protein
VAGANAWLFGSLLTAVALTAAYRVARAYEWVDIAIGVWIGTSPFLLGYGRTDVQMNFIVTGLLVLLLAGSELVSLRSAPRSRHHFWR